MREAVAISDTELHTAVEEIFVAVGVPGEDAYRIADHLVRADLRGVTSHGMTRVGIYVHRLEKGLVKRRTQPQVVRETPVSALVDANNGSGIVAAHEAMHVAVEKATSSGIGMVGVRRSNHCGMLAYYTAAAAAHGHLALATTNAPANMAPWGGRDRFFGTNPLSYAIPGGREPDVIFDMAASHVARGKIILAGKEGRRIPVGWAIDRDGNDTTDPQRALDGIVLPLGGAKGSGIAFLVETLSALLTGADFGPNLAPLYDNEDREQNVGHFFLAIRPDLLCPREEFTARMDQMISEMRRVPLADRVERIYLPGEIELLAERRRRREGIPLAPEVLEDLADLAYRYDTPSADNLRTHAETAERTDGRP